MFDAALSMVSSTSGFAPGTGRVEGVLEQDRVLGRNLRGEIAERDDGRERAAVRDGDDVRGVRVGEEIEALGVEGVDLDDRFLFRGRNRGRDRRVARACARWP